MWLTKSATVARGDGNLLVDLGHPRAELRALLVGHLARAARRHRLAHLGQRRGTLGRVGRLDLDVAVERHRLHHAAVLLDRQQLLVVEVAAVVGDGSRRRVRRDDRRLRQRDGLQVRLLRRVREVDHEADAVHLGDRLLAELAQPVVQPLAVALAGVRVGELAVAVVRQRQVAAAAVVELLDARQVGADRVGVLDADQRHLAPRRRDPRGRRRPSAPARSSSGAICSVSRCMASNFAMACAYALS